jgi:hypothetical protein
LAFYLGLLDVFKENNILFSTLLQSLRKSQVDGDHGFYLQFRALAKILES